MIDTQQAEVEAIQGQAGRVSEGPGEKQIAQENSGELAWATLILATFVIIAFIAITLMVMLGLLPIAVGVFFNTILIYWAFTPLHEASHGNIAGRHKRWRWLENAVGWATGIMLLVPFPAFREIHLQHHSFTNNPEKDPDFSARGPSFRAAFKGIASVPLHYFRTMKEHADAGRPGAARNQRLGYLFELLPLAIAFAPFPVGPIRRVALMWSLSSICAFILLATVFDWLPHHPHEARGRYVDTRATLFPGSGWLLLGQDVHIIHHLYPRIPFYRYKRVFNEIRAGIEAKGVKVEQWGLAEALGKILGAPESAATAA